MHRVFMSLRNAKGSRGIETFFSHLKKRGYQFEDFYSMSLSELYQ